MRLLERSFHTFTRNVHFTWCEISQSTNANLYKGFFVPLLWDIIIHQRNSSCYPLQSMWGLTIHSPCRFWSVFAVSLTGFKMRLLGKNFYSLVRNDSFPQSMWDLTQTNTKNLKVQELNLKFNLISYSYMDGKSKNILFFLEITILKNLWARLKSSFQVWSSR